MAVTITPYGKTADGLEVRQVVLENGPYELRALTYGATITHLFVPGRDGQKLDVLLGYSRLQDYEKGTAYLGALVGRNANRIANITMPVNGSRSNISYVLCAIAGGLLALGGSAGLTIGALVAFLNLNKSFNQPVTMLSQ